jgi:hypothetical protein
LGSLARRAAPGRLAPAAGRLAPLYADATEGRLDHWKDYPDGALALCILFDQVPRNIFRGSARAFATDTEARSVARHILAFCFDRSYPTDDHRVLCYLPFEHSEDIEDQRLALQFLMRISEVLSMNQYFRDERFASKKPKLDGTPEQQCGDNIYSLIPAIVAVNEDALNVCCRRRAGMEAWSRLPFYFHNNRPLTGPCP